MRQESGSPFLQRQQQKQFLYRGACESQRWQSKLLLEHLRYKHRYASAIDMRWRVIQRLGEFGRKYFSMLDPRQNGGGRWW